MDTHYFRARMQYTGRDSRTSGHSLYFCCPDYVEHGDPQEYFAQAFENTLSCIPRRSDLGRLMRKVGRGMDQCGITFLGEATMTEAFGGSKTVVWKPRKAKIPQGLGAREVVAGKDAIRKYNGIKGSEWVLDFGDSGPSDARYTYSFRQRPRLSKRLRDALALPF
ncbi:MAG: hypothetical protein JXC85_06455 [Candidatus Aenigmarchaeota archaeon]|nr:hypothetical protein [Candidatus Aenigmarchaeota archaeon]